MYLLCVKHCLDFIEKNPSKNPKIAQQIAFFSRQYLDALSPSNFAFTNPEAVRRTLASKGESLAKGARHLMEDLAKGQEYWNVTMTDMNAFHVGENVAVTPGKIIYQNEMMQLIQYSPTTEKVFQRPLLVIPPWINKYYILDLREEKSFVKWCVDQGWTVFMISWINPDESYRDTSFERYLEEGFLKALDVVSQVTQEKNIHALGFCLGGTLLSMALGVLQARNDRRIQTATFLATLIDFSKPGDLGVFIDEAQINALEKEMDQKGYLDGRFLMKTFNLLRANELWWHYYIQNYLYGQDPFPFDLLYWNCDSVNLPEKMFSFYLRYLYLENRLCQPQGLQIGGVPIDLSQVETPTYFVSTEQDHIAPWEAVFQGMRCFKGKSTFVLGGSGHIAGIVNPPSQNKYGFHYSEEDDKVFISGKEWVANAKKASGSWWKHWGDWLEKQSGKRIAKRMPGEGKWPALQEAPGDYVKKRFF